MQPLDEDALDEDARRRLVREGERDASIQRRVGAGLWGAALPAASLDTIVDAEMYAVLIYMRKMTSTGAADASARRCAHPHPVRSSGGETMPTGSLECS